MSIDIPNISFESTEQAIIWYQNYLHKERKSYSEMQILVVEKINSPYIPLAIFLRAHAEERVLYRLKIAIKASLQVSRSYNCAKRSLSRYSWKFLGALMLRKAGQTLMLTGKHSESFTLEKGVAPG